MQIELEGLDELLKAVTSPNYSAVGQALDLASGLVANTWEAAADGAKLPGMTRTVNWPQYAATIRHNLQGEFNATVSADSSMTEKATEPRSAWDMKPGLLAGPHARLTKGPNPHRYNVIPFQHKAENLSNEAVTALLQGIRNFRSQTGRRSQLSPIGQVAPQGGPLGPYTWATGQESGIRMGRSGPVTFRVVSDKSNPSSWWYPARPANPMVDAVWMLVEEDVADIVADGWAEALFQ